MIFGIGRSDTSARRSRTWPPRLLNVLALLFFLSVAGAGGIQSARAQSWHHGFIGSADYVDINHFGIHTHENKIGFDLRRVYMRNPQYIYVVPHCYLDTWVPGWGSIENWRVVPDGNYAVVIAPSRFADLTWFSVMSDAYRQTWPYVLDVWWYGR